MKKWTVKGMALVLVLLFGLGAVSCTMRSETGATTPTATALPSGEITEIPATPAPVTETMVEGSRVVTLRYESNGTPVPVTEDAPTATVAFIPAEVMPDEYAELPVDKLIASVEWRFVDPSGEVYLPVVDTVTELTEPDADDEAAVAAYNELLKARGDFQAVYPDLAVVIETVTELPYGGVGTALTIHGVPADLNGWFLNCVVTDIDGQVIETGNAFVLSFPVQTTEPAELDAAPADGTPATETPVVHTHEHSWSEQTTVIHHNAEYKTVHHDAEYKTVHHDAEYKTVHHDAEYKTVHHDAEYKTVHHDAEYKTVHHDAEYKTVHHDAEGYYEHVKVRDAWDEQVLVKEAWDEEVFDGWRYEERYYCTGCGAYLGSNSPDETGHDWRTCYGAFYSVPEMFPVCKTVHHDAEYTTVHHDAEYEDRWVETKPAWDEKVKVRDAWDEQVLVRAAYDEQVVTKPAWDEQVKVRDAWDEQVLVKAAYDEQVLVRAAYDESVLVHEAWDETVTTWVCSDCGARKAA